MILEALAWWQSKRPSHWDLYQHLAHPTIKCRTEQEHSLARACAAFERQRIAEAEMYVNEARELKERHVEGHQS